MDCLTTVKSPSEWLNLVARFGNANQITLVGPLHNGTFTASGPTIYVDGGARFRRSDLENFPCVSVGDGDSGDSPLDVRLPAEKDYSDLSFVLNNLPATIKDLRLFGFLGGRLDHMLANLGELHRFLAARGPGSVAELFDGGEIKVTGFNGRLERKIKGLFSLMVIDPSEIKIEGDCQYQISSPTRLESLSSHGISNRGSGLIRFNSTGPCFVMVPQE